MDQQRTFKVEVNFLINSVFFFERSENMLIQQRLPLFCCLMTLAVDDGCCSSVITVTSSGHGKFLDKGFISQQSSHMAITEVFHGYYSNVFRIYYGDVDRYDLASMVGNLITIDYEFINDSFRQNEIDTIEEIGINRRNKSDETMGAPIDPHRGGGPI